MPQLYQKHKLTRVGIKVLWYESLFIFFAGTDHKFYFTVRGRAAVRHTEGPLHQSCSTSPFGGEALSILCAFGRKARRQLCKHLFIHLPVVCESS